MTALITPEDALNAVLAATQTLQPKSVSPGDAIGRVLAEPIKADRDYPPFDRAMMDGYAVRVSDAGKNVRVAGEVAAGTEFQGEVPQGACVSIMTGAPCPRGTEAVVQKEHATRRDGAVELPAEISAERNIVRAGSECRAGDIAVPQGARVTPLHRGLMATFGITAVQVIARPVVNVVGTGSELVGTSNAPETAQIRSSNAPTLAEFVRAAGAECADSTAVKDTIDAIGKAFAKGNGNIVVSTGGVSAGVYDLVPKALETLGAEMIFHGVEQRPGKPMLFAKLGGKLFFGLSGNPMACVVGFNVYVLPALRKMMDVHPPIPTMTAKLTGAIQGRGTFTWFATGKAAFAEGECRVTPVQSRGAADMFSTAGANALIHVPPGADLADGDSATVQLLPGCYFDR